MLHPNPSSLPPQFSEASVKCDISATWGWVSDQTICDLIWQIFWHQLWPQMKSWKPWYWPWSVWTVWFLQSFIERLGLESTGGQQWQCVYIWRFMAVSCNIRLDVLIRLWGFNNNENVLWESLLFFAMCRKGWLKPFIRWNRGTNSDHVLQIWYISTTTKNTFYWISWAQASQQQWQCVFSNVASPLSIAWVIVVASLAPRHIVVLLVHYCPALEHYCPTCQENTISWLDAGQIGKYLSLTQFSPKEQAQGVTSQAHC